MGTWAGGPGAHGGASPAMIALASSTVTNRGERIFPYFAGHCTPSSACRAAAACGSGRRVERKPQLRRGWLERAGAACVR